MLAEVESQLSEIENSTLNPGISSSIFFHEMYRYNHNTFTTKLRLIQNEYTFFKQVRRLRLELEVVVSMYLDKEPEKSP
jgi:hypothetical protein